MLLLSIVFYYYLFYFLHGTRNWGNFFRKINDLFYNTLAVQRLY